MSTRWKIAKFLLSPLFKYLLGVKVHGKHNVPKDEPIIVAPNHRTYFDPPVVGYAMAIEPNEREVYFLAKEDLWKFKPFGMLIEFLNAIPLKRNAQAKGALMSAINILEKGGGVVIFPEGQRNKTDEDLLPFKMGVAFLAFHTGSKVVPAFITNTKGKAITKPWKWVFRLKPLHVYIGKPIDPKNYPKDRKGQISFMKDLRKAMEELLERARKEGTQLE